MENVIKHKVLTYEPINNWVIGKSDTGNTEYRVSALICNINKTKLVPSVSIRKFFRKGNTNIFLPTKHGVTFNKEEWDIVKSTLHGKIERTITLGEYKYMSMDIEYWKNLIKIENEIDQALNKL